MVAEFAGLMSVTWNGLSIGMPEAAALAAVALIGYLFGHRSNRVELAVLDAQRQKELERASGIARQLETIADTLRQDLACHHSQLSRFRRRLTVARDSGNEQAWKLLCAEAEMILAPTMQLAQQLSLSYDAIRQQSEALETFTQPRIDPLTGVGNGRALDEKIDILLTAARRSGVEFSIALVSLDRDRSVDTAGTPPDRKARLVDVAKLIQSCMRDSDFAARFGDEEFVVVMPQTRLAGACMFGERLRKAVVERMAATLSCGIAEYQPGDDERSLVGRADSAFYSAKAAGGNRRFVHSGSQIREHKALGTERAAETSQSAAATVIPPLDGTVNDGFAAPNATTGI